MLNLPKKYDEMFGESKFKSYHSAAYEMKVVRNVEQELGNLYSMSRGRRSYLGKKQAEFECNFRGELLKISPLQGFENRVRFAAYFLSKIK